MTSRIALFIAPSGESIPPASSAAVRNMCVLFLWLFLSGGTSPIDRELKAASQIKIGSFGPLFPHVYNKIECDEASHGKEIFIQIKEKYCLSYFHVGMYISKFLMHKLSVAAVTKKCIIFKFALN